MSFIYHDGTMIPRAKLNRAISTFKRFDRFWGKRILRDQDGNDIEVYNPTEKFYSGDRFIDEPRVTRFVKAVGMSWDELVAQDIDDEIESMYFFLEDGFEWDGSTSFGQVPAFQGSTPNVKPTRPMISSALDRAFLPTAGEDIDVRITYGGDSRRYLDEHDLPWRISDSGIIEILPLNTEEIRSVLHSNPWYYLANSRHVPYDKNSNPFYLYNGNADYQFPQGTSGASPRTLPTAGVSSTVSGLACFALLDTTHSVFEPVLVENVDSPAFGQVRIKDETIITRSTGNTSSEIDVNGNPTGEVNAYDGGGEILEYSYTLSFRYTGVGNFSYLVSEMYNWYDHLIDITDPKLRLTDVEHYRNDYITSTLDTRIKRELKKLMWDDTVAPPNTPASSIAGSPPIVKDGLYLKIPNVSDDGSGEQVINYTNYLMTEPMRAMKKRHFIKLISTKLDSDYTVEDQEWWEPLLFIVLVIVSVVVAYFTSGLSIKFTIGALASFAGGVALGFTVSGLIMSEVGGLSSQGYVKTLGQFATIIGYVAVLLGIFAIIQSLAKAAVEKSLTAAAQEAGKDIASDAAKEAISAAASSQVSAMTATELASAAIEGALNSISGAFTQAAMGSVGQLANGVLDMVGLITQGYDYYLDQEAKEVEALKDEYEELVDEQNEEILNRPYTNSPMVFSITMERLSSPDMLQEMSIKKDEYLGRDKSFAAWEADVNV